MPSEHDDVSGVALVALDRALWEDPARPEDWARETAREAEASATAMGAAMLTCAWVLGAAVGWLACAALR